MSPERVKAGPTFNYFMKRVTNISIKQKYVSKSGK
jgi:hypothetical protein